MTLRQVYMAWLSASAFKEAIMYHIIKNGEEIGTTERLTHVKMQSNGVPIIHSDGAQIAYGGEIYNVGGQPHVGEYDTVLVTWQDDVPVLSATLATHAQQIAAAENAACEMDTANDERFTDIENALCDVDSAESEG